MNDIDKEIQELQRIVSDAQQALASAQQSLAAWKAAAAKDEQVNASYATRANTAKRIDEETANVKAAQEALDNAKAELSRKLALRDKIDQAAVDAMRQGLTPEAAYQLATAKVIEQERRSKIANTALLVGLGVLALVLIVWAFKKYAAK